MLLTYDEEFVDLEPPVDVDLNPNPEENVTLTEISLNFVLGIINPKTLKLKGMINDSPVLVLWWTREQPIILFPPPLYSGCVFR